MKASGRSVLDSFALLAYLADEPGAGIVREALERGREHGAIARMSVINLGECLYIVEREQGLEAARMAVAVMDHLPIEVVPANRERTFAAAHIKAHYKVSYADAFAVALAQESQGAVLTGDPEFMEVEPFVPVIWLPR